MRTTKSCRQKKVGAVKVKMTAMLLALSRFDGIAPAVYMNLECVTKVFLTFIAHSFLIFESIGQPIAWREKISVISASGVYSFLNCRVRTFFPFGSLTLSLNLM